MVAVFVSAEDVAATRHAVRNLLLPRQRRLHMSDEREARRKEITDVVSGLPVRGTVYTAGRRHDNNLNRRAICLRSIVHDAARDGVSRLIIERDSSLISFDRQRLIEYSREAMCADTLDYAHREPRDELLLGLPDAIAWCWAKGGHWRQRVHATVTRVVQL